MKRSRAAQGDENSPRRYNKGTFIAPNLLLVEGPDEFHFFRFLRPRDDLQIHVYEGKDQLRLELATIRGVEGFDQVRQVAIVRDADQDPKAAMQSVLSQWTLAFGVNEPRVASDQWFEDEEGRRWSVWIMPSPDGAGDLEELLWQAVSASDHRDCIDNLIECLDQCQPVPFTSKTKARLYAWLSTQRDPLKELFWAFRVGARFFDPQDAVFTRFGSLIDNM